MEELHSVGLAEALKYALSRIDPDGKRHLHVSFDIDALDPTEAPATGTRGKYYVFVILFKHRKKKGKICHMMMAL